MIFCMPGQPWGKARKFAIGRYSGGRQVRLPHETPAARHRHRPPGAPASLRGMGEEPLAALVASPRELLLGAQRRLSDRHLSAGNGHAALIPAAAGASVWAASVPGLLLSAALFFGDRPYGPALPGQVQPTLMRLARFALVPASWAGRRWHRCARARRGDAWPGGLGVRRRCSTRAERLLRNRWLLAPSWMGAAARFRSDLAVGERTGLSGRHAVRWPPRPSP